MEAGRASAASSPARVGPSSLASSAEGATGHGGLVAHGIGHHRRPASRPHRIHGHGRLRRNQRRHHDHQGHGQLDREPAVHAQRAVSPPDARVQGVEEPGRAAPGQHAGAPVDLRVEGGLRGLPVRGEGQAPVAPQFVRGLPRNVLAAPRHRPPYRCGQLRSGQAVARASVAQRRQLAQDALGRSGPDPLELLLDGGRGPGRMRTEEIRHIAATVQGQLRQQRQPCTAQHAAGACDPRISIRARAQAPWQQRRGDLVQR